MFKGAAPEKHLDCPASGPGWGVREALEQDKKMSCADSPPDVLYHCCHQMRTCCGDSRGIFL